MTPLGTGTVTIASGATLDLNFLQLDNPLNALTGAILLNTGTSQTVDVTDSVIFSGTTAGTVVVENGGSAEFHGDVNATVTVVPGAAAVFDASAGGTPTVTVQNGGVVAVAGTAAGSWTVAGTGTFSGPLVGSLAVNNGGFVAFSGSSSNGPSSSFNVAAGGLVNVASAATIGGQLHVSGSAVIAGAITSDADVIVESGGRVTLVDGASFAQNSLLNDGNLIIDRDIPLALATAVSGSGGLEKLGLGVLELLGANTFSGPTAVNGGTLLLQGSLASDVIVAAATTLGGSGSIAGAISGAGFVSPGNSPGILEAAAFDPTGGLGAEFEFTAFAPNYSVTGTGALNDVLRLTAAAPFNDGTLTAGNVFDVYLNRLTVEYQDQFEGGFYAEQFTPEQLLAAVQNATFVGWIRTTGAGVRSFGGFDYNPIDYNPALPGFQVTTKAGPGGVGAVTEFIAIPEPSTVCLASLGLLGLLGHVTRLRQWLRMPRR